MKYFPYFYLVLLSFFITNGVVFAHDQKMKRASAIYTSITSKKLSRASKDYQDIVNLAQSEDWKAIAQKAVEDDLFIDSTALQFAYHLIRKENENDLVLDDALGLVVGVIRDNLDARSLLTGNELFVPSSRLGQITLSSNEAFVRLTERNLSLKKFLKKRTPQWNLAEVNQAAGILTTRGWAQRYYNMGTNRIAVVKLLEGFLCSDIPDWRAAGIPTFRIRRDIDRAPGGDPNEFQSKCVTCHSGMDAMAGAFSHLNYEGGRLRFLYDVASKYNQNETVFPQGYVTYDRSWINLFYLPQHQKWGIKGNESGEGVLELGKLISESSGFARCMSSRVVEHVCRKKVSTESKEIKRFAARFKGRKYSFKSLFVDVAAADFCFED